MSSRVEPSGAPRCEANVLELGPTQREQAQRIEGAEQRGKHGDSHPGTTNLAIAPPGASQYQDFIILDPSVVSEGDGYRDYFGGCVVEDDRQNIKPDRQKPTEGERTCHHEIIELRRLVEDLLDHNRRHDHGGGNGQLAKHAAMDRDHRCPAG